MVFGGNELASPWLIVRRCIPVRNLASSTWQLGCRPHNRFLIAIRIAVLKWLPYRSRGRRCIVNL